MTELEKKERQVTKMSCGFILQVRKHLLFCRPTGSKLLDFPKGMREYDETPLAAALRELREETGIVLGTTALKLVDLGQGPYSKQKNIHLFYITLEEIDVTKLWCESSFATRWNTFEPEIASYTMLTLSQAWPKLAVGMKRYLRTKRNLLNLDDWPIEETIDEPV